MGCHSWFYVHLPEKREEMERYFISKVQERTYKRYKMWEDFNPDEFPKYLSSIKDHLEYYHNHTLEEIIEAHPEVNPEIIKSNKLLMDLEWDKKYEQIKQYHLEQAKQSMNAMNSINSIEEYLSHPKQERPDFLYIIYNDKVYIEACDGEEFGIQPMHDMFRIYNYDAEPCYSVEDVLQRCQENNVTLSDEQLKQLKEWFIKYPDTIIKFG